MVTGLVLLSLLTIIFMMILWENNGKEFVDDNFEFYENGRNFSKWLENSVWKGEIARIDQFLLFA